MGDLQRDRTQTDILAPGQADKRGKGEAEPGLSAPCTGRRTMRQWLSPFDTYSEWLPALRRTIRYPLDGPCVPPPVPVQDRAARTDDSDVRS